MFYYICCNCLIENEFEDIVENELLVLRILNELESLGEFERVGFFVNLCEKFVLVFSFVFIYYVWSILRVGWWLRL